MNARWEQSRPHEIAKSSNRSGHGIDREMMSISIDFLRQVLTYDPDTGFLYWVGSYQGERQAGYIGKGGYRYVQIKRQRFLAHRVAWALHYSEWPNQFLDHVNSHRADNRIVNLRLANPSENNWNKTLQTNNTSGFKGVTFHRASGKYVAQITVQKVRHRLGSFDTAEQAHAAYVKAAQELHGEFHHV